MLRRVGFAGYGEGSLWLLPLSQNRLERVGRAGTRQHRSLTARRAGLRRVWIAHGVVWTSGYMDATIWKLDAETGRVAGNATLSRGLVAGVAAAHAFWAGTTDGRLLRVDAGRYRVTDEARLGVNVGIAGPSATMVLGGNALWVTALSRCDGPPAQP